MTLATYKFIFFWEWVHRLLARTIGLVFAAPLAWFWLRGQIPAGYKPRLLALLALGGLQGAVGWWMVKSGIVHDVKVSHYRSRPIWRWRCSRWAGSYGRCSTCARWRVAKARAADRAWRAGARMLALQLVYGAFLAGLRAGVVAGPGGSRGMPGR
jgi:cytochrome c oxidase assembly protein subunit 15